MKMKNSLRLFILLSAVMLLAACPRPTLFPLAGRAAIPSSSVAGNPVISPLPLGATTFSGQVEQAKFRVQETFGEVAPNAMVTLFDPVTGVALGTAVTTNVGTFTMQFPGDFVPDKDGKVYVLESVKGGKAQGFYNSVGAPAIRLRTLMRWNAGGAYWQSITNTASGSAVLISRSTTALSIASGLRQATTTNPGTRALFTQGLINDVDKAPFLEVGKADATIQPQTPDTFSENSQTSIKNAEFHALFALVDQALLNGQDPVGSIAMANSSKFPGSAPEFVLVPAGFAVSGSFAPGKGKAGTRVTLLGAGFPRDASRIQLIFAGGADAKALSIDSTGTLLSFDVPVGARTGPVTLKVTFPGTSADLTVMAPSFTVLTSDGHRVVDDTGNLWLVGRANNTLWTLSPGGVWTRKAQSIQFDGPRGLTLRTSDGAAVFTSWNSGSVFRLLPGLNQQPVAFSQGGSNKLKNPWGIAQEASGSYLVASFGRNEVMRLFESGAVTPIASVSQAAGIALDSEGNAYVSSWSDGTLYRLASASITVPVPVMTGLARPAGVAVMPDGTVAVACYGSDSIARMTPGGGVLTALLPRGTHLGVIDVASDDQGRLFVGAFDSHTIARIDPSGAVADLALAPRNVWGLAANASNDIAVGIINDLWPYSARPRDTRVYIAPFSAGNYQPFVAVDGFGNPEAVTWSSTGDLYVADSSADRLVRVSQPPNGPRTTLVQGIGRVAQLAVGQAGRIYLAALNGALSIWDPAQPGKLTRFAPGRTHWAVARDQSGINPNTYVGGPRDGQILAIGTDGSVSPLANVPGVTGLTYANGTLYALSSTSGDINLVNTSSGVVQASVNLGPGAIDITSLGTDLFVAMESGAIKKVNNLGQVATVHTLANSDTPVRIIRGPGGSPTDLFLTTRKAGVVRLSNLSGAPGATTIASISAFAGPALQSEIGTESLNGLTGLAFDGIGDLYVAQTVAHSARIFQIRNSAFGADHSTASPWLTVDAPIMGLASNISGGNTTLLTANPQEGYVASAGPLDSSIGFAIRTSDKAVSSLGLAVGRLVGVGLVPPGFSNFYLLTSPTYDSTGIALVTGGASWRRQTAQAPCCGANHPFVDTSGTLLIPSYSGFQGIRAIVFGGSVTDFTGASFGAMSGVVTDAARSGGLVGGSLGGGTGNAPLLRFTSGQSPLALDNWPYEPGF